jgi:predicted 2-oxoglutarate/Fe(II)-dependent dioxygenase YbiX
MINYTINNFFDSDTCERIQRISIEKGIRFAYGIDEYDTWDCRMIYDDKLKEEIYNVFKNKTDLNLWFDFKTFNCKNINLSLTRYYDGRRLDLHKDTASSLTTVILLTDDFEGGDFILSNNHEQEEITVKLEKGQGICFDGSKVFHGVKPVNKGVRCAFNVWMNDNNYEFIKHKDKQTLI